MTKITHTELSSHEEIWDAYIAVALRKMPVCTTMAEKSFHIEARRQEALQLAAAALRAAGEHALAQNLPIEIMHG